MWRIGRVVDLSMRLDGVTPVYPGDPPFSMEPVSAFNREGFVVHRLELSTHAGTHLDAPLHTCCRGLSVDGIPLGNCAGEGLMVDLRGKKAGEPIKREDFSGLEERLSGEAFVLLHTGWSGKGESRSTSAILLWRKRPAASCCSGGCVVLESMLPGWTLPEPPP